MNLKRITVRPIRQLLMVLAALVVSITSSISVQTATAPSAQAAVVKYEYIVNKWEGDLSNTAIYASGLVFETIPSGQYRFKNYRSFTIPSRWCAEVSYNHGPWRLRGPGTHYFEDGAHIQVDPYLC